MFKIKNNDIFLTRGDKATINLSIIDYKFKVGDIVKFKLYNANALNKEAILIKEIEIKEETDDIDIELSSEETRIGKMRNTAVEFWYEIELNNNQTALGYDDEGPKRFILYPEGMDINE